MVAVRRFRSDKSKVLDLHAEPATWKRLSERKKALSALIERFAAALVESERTGARTGFHVEVDPAGNVSFTPLQARARKPLGPNPGAADSLQEALAAARRRGTQRAAEILSGDDMLSGQAFADLLGTSRMTVNTKRAQNKVLGLEGAKRGFRYPVWQIDRNGKPFSVLPDLFDQLGGSPWEVYRFLVQKHPELNGLSGREALAHGQDRKVLEVAESIARNFA